MKKIKDINYITEEGLKLLKQEYDERTNKKRNDIAERIDEARRFGDLSENNAYTSVLEEKDFNEARIAELVILLQTSQVVKDDGSRDIVTIGKTVHLKNKKGSVIYRIVGMEESDPLKNLISDKSPLGKSLLGKREGEIIKVEIPSGILEFTLIKIE